MGNVLNRRLSVGLSMRPLPILWAATALCFRFVRPCACGAPAPVFSEGALKMQDQKMQDLKMKDQMS